ncbi:hypothetical protein ACWCRC_41930, partial [Streptomyces sp. NPDC001940]
MPLTLTITGTRSTDHHELTWYADLFARYLGAFADDESHFYIGGAKGIDSLTLSQGRQPVLVGYGVSEGSTKRRPRKGDVVAVARRQSRQRAGHVDDVRL